MVFYRIVRPPRKHLRHLRPFVAVGSVRQKKGPFLMRHPLYLENAGIEVVMPSLTALLAQPTLHEFGDEGPSLRPVFFDQFSNKVVLLLCPRLLPQEARTVIFGLQVGVVVILLDGLLLEGLLHHSNRLNLKITVICNKKSLKIPPTTSPSRRPMSES
jgi:hypothetical protein